MGASKREEQVLKLVHPGRHVETYTQPISAAEILRKNPRHSIARPDVFQFPYIVVSSESVLFPGDVFYIVPNTTIYRLLKEREHEDHPPSGQNLQAAKNHGRRRNPKQVSPVKSLVGTTPMYLDEHDQDVLKQFHHNNQYVASPQDTDPDTEESLTRQSRVKSGPERIKRSLSSACHWEQDFDKKLTRQHHVKSGHERSKSPREQDVEKNLTRQSHVKSLPQRTKSTLSSGCLMGITKNRNTHQEFESFDKGKHADSSLESRASRGRREHHFNRRSTGQALPPSENGDLQINNNREQLVTLKSCLRKQDSVPRLQNLKVSFATPIITTTTTTTRRRSLAVSRRSL